MNNTKKLVCLYGGLAFFLGSCGVPAAKKNRRAASVKHSVVDPQLQEAWLSDIPIILGAVRTEQKNNELLQLGQQVLHFKSDMENAEVAQFYRQEMERMGWQETAFFEGRTTFLIVEKPYKVVLVSIHETTAHKKKITHITILIGNKE